MKSLAKIVVVFIGVLLLLFSHQANGEEKCAYWWYQSQFPVFEGKVLKHLFPNTDPDELDLYYIEGLGWIQRTPEQIKNDWYPENYKIKPKMTPSLIGRNSKFIREVFGEEWPKKTEIKIAEQKASSPKIPESRPVASPKPVESEKNVTKIKPRMPSVLGRKPVYKPVRPFVVPAMNDDKKSDESPISSLTSVQLDLRVRDSHFEERTQKANVDPKKEAWNRGYDQAIVDFYLKASRLLPEDTVRDLLEKETERRKRK